MVKDSIIDDGLFLVTLSSGTVINVSNISVIDSNTNTIYSIGGNPILLDEKEIRELVNCINEYVDE